MIWPTAARRSLLAAALSASSIAAWAQGGFPGAIYTSKIDGTTVNANLYETKTDVYLNGGPQNANANGLPDGTYYFQVTDPNGAVLLSTDAAVCRQVKVLGGYIKGAVNDAACLTGIHPNGNTNPATGAIPVQLAPFNDTPNNGGEYKVWLIRQASPTKVAADGLHISFVNADSKTDNFKVRQPACTGEGCDPNTPLTLSGLKFYDANANGQYDSGEAPVAGVQINVSLPNSNVTSVQTTDASGNWSFGPVFSGDAYKVNETKPLSTSTYYWVQTAPQPDFNNFQGYQGFVGTSNVTGLNFGNVCFVPPAGGLTLGFWSNQNGKTAMTKYGMDKALAELRALNLKNWNGADFDPATYDQFRTWLLNGNAVNMAYMLSVQMAATYLDVQTGSLKGATLVDAQQFGLGIVSIQTLLNAANAELAMTGGNLTYSGNPLRVDEEMIKNALDGINNNRIWFASATPCAVTYPAPVAP